MLRVTLLIMATAGFVVFGLSNVHRVGLRFVVGETDVRLIFLLMVSFIVGAFVTVMYQMVESARRRSSKGKIRVVRTRAPLTRDPFE
jgi:uncharacterized integral membrane protein